MFQHALPGLVSGGAVALAAVAGVLWWYGKPISEAHRALLAEFPVVQRTVSAMGERLNGAELKIQDWLRQQDEVKRRVTTLETGFSRKLEAVRDEARRARAATVNEVRVELAQRDEHLDSRIAQIESARQQDQKQLTALRSDVTRLNQTLEQQHGRLTAIERNGYEDRQFVDQRLAALQQRADQNRSETQRVARSLEKHRVDFEISKGHSRELAPGLSMGLSGTDVAHRRVEGWLWIMPDRKTVWVRGQNALEPLEYYSSSDGKRREVVFTHVTRNSAVGYVLLPADRAPGATLATLRD